MTDNMPEVVIEEYEHMSREDLIACCHAHDEHHLEHHIREGILIEQLAERDRRIKELEMKGD